MLLNTTARFIYNDPVTANPAFKRRFLLCWGLWFDDLLGFGGSFLSLSGHFLSPLLDVNGVHEYLVTIPLLLASIFLRHNYTFFLTKAELDEHHLRTP